MNTEKFKELFKNFFEREFKEIQENKIRFIALVFFTIIAVGFMFADDDSEQIELNEPVRVEQEKIVEIGDKSTEDNKKVIFVKKNISEDEEKNVTAVIGENQDDYVYIRDPFAVEEKIEVAEKIDVSDIKEIPAMMPKIPEIPAITHMPTNNLPPIPEPDLALLIPHDKPIMPENKLPVDEFILEGTVICGSNKNALIKKISPTQDNKYREEDIIVKVGDSIQGQQITDIKNGKIILNNGENYMYLSGFEISSVEDDIFDNEIASADLNDDSILNDDNFSDIPADFKISDTLDKEENVADFVEDSFIDEEIIETDFDSVELETEKNSNTDNKSDITTDTANDFTDFSVEDNILSADSDINSDDLSPDLNISPPSQK